MSLAMSLLRLTSANVLQIPFHSLWISYMA